MATHIYISFLLNPYFYYLLFLAKKVGRSGSTSGPPVGGVGVGGGAGTSQKNWKGGDTVLDFDSPTSRYSFRLFSLFM